MCVGLSLYRAFAYNSLCMSMYFRLYYIRYGPIGPRGRASRLDQWASPDLRSHGRVRDGHRQGECAARSARGLAQVTIILYYIKL